MGFAHLHLHTEYSLLDGECRISAIPDAVKRAGQTAVAVTDHGVMYGAVDFYKACVAAGVKPIIGCEVYVAPRGMEQKEHMLDSDYSHLVLLAENEVGYKNLVAIVSNAFTKGFYQKPRTDIEELTKHSEGLIALSGCISGSIPKAILAGDMSLARERMVVLDRIFGRGSFFLELQRHGIKGQEDVNRVLVRFSRELGIPLVATNDVHYISRKDSEIQKLLTAVSTGGTVDDNPLAMDGSEHYIKSSAEMQELFRDIPEAVENAGRIADRCSFDFDFSHMHLPAFRPPLPYTSQTYLRKLCRDGYAAMLASGRIRESAEYAERLEYELGIIDSMGFNDYYLIVWDFVNYARKRGIPVGPGRGSGVGSLCAYCLGITQVDPIEFGLLFERFLNPERVSMPDFDIDFCDERRGEVIEYVSEKYGRSHVAQIITFGTLACRQAVRDAGRALGMSYAATDAVARMLPRYMGVTVSAALKENPELKRSYESDASVKRLIDSAISLEGRPRNSSTHATGVVITDEPLTTYLPLALNDSVTVTQYTMNTVAELGLLKIDFLGLRFLTIIYGAEAEIRKKEPGFSIDSVAFDDSATYEMLSEGRSVGLFQLESEGMRNLLTRLKPRNLEDIISVISLYRPGPALSIDAFLKNRLNPEKTSYILPQLKDILSNTCGVLLYQEQVMQVCRVLAGYSYGRADIVRRAMAKKKPEAMASEKSSFLEGAVKNGVPESDAAEVFSLMSEFAKYAFNKSHAAAYAVVAYRTAYLKCRYPREYMCSLLNTVMGYNEKVGEYISDCAEMNIGILPPDVRKSEKTFSVEENNLRFGLAAIRNVGILFAERILRERERRSFGTIEDFLTRCAQFGSIHAFESLIYAGALDCFGIYRSRLMAGIDTALETVGRDKSRNSEGQMSLFGGEEGTGAFEFPVSALEELPKGEILSREKENTGLYFSGHPLEGYQELVKRISATDTAQMRTMLENGSLKSGSTIKFVGLVTKKRSKITKKNDIMAFVDAEDESGELEIIVFPSLYIEFGAEIEENKVYVFTGVPELKAAYGDESGEKMSFILRSVSTPETEAALVSEKPKQAEAEHNGEKPQSLYIKVTDGNEMRLGDALAIADDYPGGARILIYFEGRKQLRAVKDKRILICEKLIKQLKLIMGDANVAVK